MDSTPLIIHSPNAPQDRALALQNAGAVLVPCPSVQSGRLDLAKALDLLWRHGITSVMVEGGAEILASMLGHGAVAVDAIVVTVCPRLVRGGVTVDVDYSRLEGVEYHTLGADVVMTASCPVHELQVSDGG